MQRNLLYTYHPCMICIDISVSDMRTTCSGMHIVCVRYVYTFIVCISDTDDMCTKYYLPWYAYQTWTIVHYTNIVCV